MGTSERLSAIAAVLALLPAGVRAQHLVDETGGDCAQAGWGVYVAAERSCTLVADLQGTITLAADGLKLDGGGHTLTARPGDQVGVGAAGRRGLKVENLTVRGFEVGIQVKGGADNAVRKVKAVAGLRVAGRPSCGILLDGAQHDVVDDNDVEDNAGSGICLDGAKRNHLGKNKVLRNQEAGIVLVSSDRNTIARNTIGGAANALSTGVDLFASSDNLILGNDVDANRSRAVGLVTSDRNLVTFNILTANVGGGVVIDTSADNHVICNDSTGSQLGVDISAGSTGTLTFMNNFYATDSARDRAGAPFGNLFNLQQPVGGNYWKVHAPLCVDLNADGFCDAPYRFNGNQDNEPWVAPVPWRIDPLTCLGWPGPQKPDDEERPRVDALVGWEGVELFRDLERAVAAGDPGRLAERLSSDALLLDGSTPVAGAAAVAKALSGRAQCAGGSSLVRPLALPAARDGFLLAIGWERCGAPAEGSARLLALVETGGDAAARWKIRRIVLDP